MTIDPLLLQDSIDNCITFQSKRAELESNQISPPSSFIKEMKETQFNMSRDYPIRKLEKTNRSQANEPGGVLNIPTAAFNHRSSATDDVKVESKHRARYKKLLNESLERQKDKDKSGKNAKKKKEKSTKKLKKKSKGKTKKSKETSKANDNDGSDSTVDTLEETYSPNIYLEKKKANHVFVVEEEPESEIDLFCDSDSDESSLWSDDEYAHLAHNKSKSFCERGGSFWQLEMHDENLRDFTSKVQTAS